MEELKLSELAEDVELAKEETSSIFTVAELKHEILNFGDEDHFIGQWFTVEKKKWKPDAQWMIQCYIENEHDQMYEDWDEVAMDCVSDVLVQNIQTLLDEAFDTSARTYCEWDKPVEIDILPEVLS